VSNPKNEEGQARSKTWRLLNSPFGIWCLSSVILASVTTGWTLFHTWLTEQKEQRQKRIALACELTIRATDFLEDCKKSLSRQELWDHHYQFFQKAEGHLTQFSSATMDELVFQYRLLPGRGDQDAAQRLTDASDEIYTLFGGSAEFNCIKSRVLEIVSRQIIGTAKRDAETNGSNSESAEPQLKHDSEKNPCP